MFTKTLVAISEAVGVGDSIHSSPVAIRGDLVLMSYCKLVERRDGDSTTLLAFSMFSGVIYMYVMQSGQFHMYKINKFSVTVPSTVSKDLTLALCMTVQDGSGLT